MLAIPFFRVWILVIGIGAGCLGVSPRSFADDAATFAHRAEASYNTAKTRFETQTNDALAQWQFARACFDWAELVSSDTERARIAHEGMAASHLVLAKDKSSAAGHYYLALNLGELARTESLGALKLVEEMEAQFKIVLTLDPAFDYGGADRGLGLLYRDAPGWPASIGNRSKAYQHLQHAIKISPGHPENLLNLIETELKWGDHASAQRLLKTLDDIWPDARQRLTGDAWAASWADWETRRAESQKKAAAAKPTATKQR